MGKKSSKSKTTVEPPSWARPLIEGAANTMLNTVNSNQPQLQQLTSSLTGILPQFQNMALDTSKLQPGFQFANDELTGKYLNNNPYVENMAHQAEQDAGNAVNATFSKYGRTGSTDHATDLAKGVAQAGNQVRFQNYQNERGLQNAALGQLPGLNLSQYAGLSPLLGAYQTAGQLPYAGIGSLSGIGSMFGGYGTTTQPKQGGLLGGLLGGILGL